MTDQVDLQPFGEPPASPGGVDARSLMSTIAGLPDLYERQVDHDRLLAAEGAGHIVHDLPLRSDGRMVALESRPWRLDPVPLVIDGHEFVALADGAIADADAGGDPRRPLRTADAAARRRRRPAQALGESEVPSRRVRHTSVSTLADELRRRRHPRRDWALARRARSHGCTRGRRLRTARPFGVGTGAP